MDPIKQTMLACAEVAALAGAFVLTVGSVYVAVGSDAFDIRTLDQAWERLAGAARKLRETAVLGDQAIRQNAVEARRYR